MGNFKSVIKNKNFALLWMSQVLSQLTINIMNFLLLIQLFKLTQSSIATSLLWLSYAIPSLFFGPIAAVFVDLFDKKKILLITNLLQSMLILTFTFFHTTNIFLSYGVVFMYSLINQFYGPAESSSIPYLVTKSDLPYANSLFLLTQQGALIFGYGLAGIISQFLGFTTSFYIAGGLLFVAFLATVFIKKINHVSKYSYSSFDDALINFFKNIYEGYLYIKSNKIILSPFVLMLVFQIMLSVVTVSVPVIAKDIFKVDPALAAYYVIIPSAIGSALGAIITPRQIRKKMRKKKIIEIASVLMIASMIALAFVVNGNLGLWSVVLGLLSIVLIGASFVSVIISVQTLLQVKVNEELRGRVFGNLWFVVTVLSILPVMFGGAIIQVFGIRLLFAFICSVAITILLVSKKYYHIVT